MADEIIKARVWWKVDSEANWNANPLILGPGEPAWVINNNGQGVNVKIGDGTKLFSQLPYFIEYDQGQFEPIEGTVLPEPSGVQYSIVGPGTYTRAGQPDIVVPGTDLGILYGDGTTWSLGSSVELPTVQGVDIIDPNGSGIPSEKGTARYAPSKNAVGILSVENGQNIAAYYNTAASTDTNIFDIDKFYDKRNGSKGTSTDFICTKILDDIIGGISYDFNFYLHGFAGVVFFDKNGVFVTSIGTTNTNWEDVTGTIALPANVAKVGYTFPKNVPAKKLLAFLKAREAKQVATSSVFLTPTDGVKKADVSSVVTETGTKIVDEPAVRAYATSFDFLGITVTKAGQNIASKYSNASPSDTSLFSINTFYDKRNGSKLTSADFIASKVLEPIKGGVTYEYYFKLYGYAGVCFFDKNDMFLFSIAPPTTSSEWVALTGSINLPSDVAKIGYTFPKSLADGRTNAYMKPLTDVVSVTDKVFQPAGSTPEPEPTKGKILWCGDSTVEFRTIVQQVGALLGYIGLNAGIGGTKFTPHPDQYYNKLSFFQIVDAIVSGDFTEVNSALDSLILAAETGTPPDIGKANRLRATKQNLNDTDFSTLEVFGFRYGTNDYTGGDPIGDISITNKDTSTIVGSINYGIDKLLTAFPNLKIIIDTPTHRMVGTSPTWISSDVRVISGRNLLEISNAIEDTAMLNHVPCNNFYKEGFFNIYNHTTYFVDQVHQNDLGAKVMAEQTAGFINSKIFKP